MHAELERLESEHGVIRRMLAAFEAELERLEAATQPDHDVLEGAVEFCRAYLDAGHHAREDWLHERLQRYPEGRARSDPDLAAQHERLGALTGELAVSLAAVREGAVLERAQLAALGHTLLAAYRHHLEDEERAFFPLLERTLQQADWQALQSAFPPVALLEQARLERRFAALMRALEDPAGDGAG